MVYASPGTDASTDPDIDKNIRMVITMFNLHFSSKF